MEFAHPPPVHISNANMSIPPPSLNVNPLGSASNQSGFPQKYDRPNNFNNITPINSNNQGRPPFRPFINIQRPLPGPLSNMTLEDFDGKRLRKSVMRKTVDYNSAIISALQNRVWQRDCRDRRALQPDVMYYPGMMPPPSYPDNPINCVTTRFVKTATNKMRCPIFCMAWTPEGRRLVTGASSGEFTLWNGLTFNFETILQAHDSPVRCMVWSHSDSWMVTGDHAGYVKYWQSNMNNVKMFQAHKEALRGISFSPSDAKFVTCSDDGTLRIWDFLRYQEERVLRGHGADVKCVHWHPQRSLIISGSKDNQQPIKLWDPKTGQSLATLHAHKSTVMDLKWNDNGNWLITASRDNLVKLFDLRNLNQEVQTFRGHKREASSVAWHPIHEGLFSSGGADGSIMFWHVGADKEVGAIEQAHDSIVWTLAWHPLGHILCSGSNDHTSKFWTRNRPGDLMRDKYNLNTLPAGLTGIEELDVDEPSIIPGMGPDDKVEYTVLSESGSTEIPGLDLEVHNNLGEDKVKTKKVPYSKPIPRNFQAQWNETIPSEDDISNSLNDGLFPENATGAVPLQKLASNANGLIMCGKYVAVEPGSKLEAAIAEGPKYLYEFIVSGQVPELMEVIDQIREEYRLYNKEYLEEDSEEFQETVESPPKRPLPLLHDEFYENPNLKNKSNFSEGNRQRNSRFSDIQDDQDLRQGSTFNNIPFDNDMRNINDINFRQQNMDLDFRQQHDQDMRHLNLEMADQDFRGQFNRDGDYRHYEDENVDDYEEGDDYDEDGSNWHNENFSNGQFANNRNYNNSNFQGFRQQPFSNRNEPIWQAPQQLQDNGDNFRNNRGRRGGGNFRNMGRPHPWIQRPGPPPRGGQNSFKGQSRNKSAPRNNRGRY